MSLKTIVALCCGAVCSCLCGCGLGPNVDVTAAIVNGRVVFHVPHRRINGIIGILVEDNNGKPIWDVSTASIQDEIITFGVLPTSGDMDPKQKVPVEGEPVPDIRGKTVTITIKYQFDVGITPAMGDFRKTVYVPAQ